jgi:cytochrome c553
LIAVAFAIALGVDIGADKRVEAAPPQFSRDVRPILAQACFHCHGPDAAHRQADLRLDEEAGLRTAFTPRDLAKSEAWRRIQSTDPMERMPPPESPHQLKPAQIETLRKWVEAGAEWQGHWAFIPPAKPPVPAVKDTRWGAHPIDAFVLARLETEGLRPQPEADRERLLRRVSFDLTGLPPTPAEIDAFLGDRDEKAFERVVDRLLSSEHFGERMALAWLDAARYGDSSVFHADGPRDMWAWRDWTIRAYNRNLPFDRFTIEQLAGDLLPDANDDTRIATGFLRNNATTDEGGAIAEEFRVEYAIDRVKTTSVVWMGLTMECGQCHNHKYDPITQQD